MLLILHTKYKFTGQEKDLESALYNFRARMYDDGIVRFYAPDEQWEDFGRYAFVRNDPEGRVDRNGELSAAAYMPTPRLGDVDQYWWTNSGGTDSWGHTTTPAIGTFGQTEIGMSAPEGHWEPTGAHTSREVYGDVTFKDGTVLHHMLIEEIIDEVAWVPNVSQAEDPTIGFGVSLDALGVMYAAMEQIGGTASRYANLYNAGEIVQNVGRYATKGVSAAEIGYDYIKLSRHDMGLSRFVYNTTVHLGATTWGEMLTPIGAAAVDQTLTHLPDAYEIASNDYDQVANWIEYLESIYHRR